MGFRNIIYPTKQSDISQPNHLKSQADLCINAQKVGNHPSESISVSKKELVQKWEFNRD